MTIVTNFDQLVKLETGEIFTIPEILKAEPNMSIPDGISAEAMFSAGYALVFPVDPPAGDVVTLGDHVQRPDGYFEQTWNVRPFTPGQLAQQFADQQEQLRLSVTQLRADAMAIGAPIDFDNGKPGPIGIKHIGLQSDNGVFASFALRIRVSKYVIAGNTTATLRIRTLEGTAVTLSVERIVALCNLIDSQYAEIWGIAADLTDEIDFAENASQLPTLPEKIEVDAAVLP